MVSETKPPSTVRKSPCASCPYRKLVPSGVWHEEEYEKLPAYDGDFSEQIEHDGLAPFGCHHADGQICAGWAGHRDPLDMLAVRLGISAGSLDPSVAEYKTTVPLFESGAAAAEHGMAEIDNPSPRAIEMSKKITRLYLAPKSD